MENIKVIFLDIDGVLNSYDSLLVNKELFEQKCIKNVNKIIEETGAEIVISSTWRINNDINQLRQMFKGTGLEDHIIGKTPVSIRGYATRGSEIKEWLAMNIMAQIDEVTNFVIIDDNKDMEDLVKHLVRTNPRLGLTEEDAKKAIKILNS